MNTKQEELFTHIDEIFANENDGFTKERYPELSQLINSNDELAEILPEFRDRCKAYDEKTAQCDRLVKEYTESKQMWKGRRDQLMGFLAHMLNRLKFKSISANGVKATLSTREILETDNDALLEKHIACQEYQALANVLPPYVKISLSIDKTALKGFIKVDDTLLIEHPEWVHTKESQSVSLK